MQALLSLIVTQDCILVVRIVRDARHLLRANTQADQPRTPAHTGYYHALQGRRAQDYRGLPAAHPERRDNLAGPGCHRVRLQQR